MITRLEGLPRPTVQEVLADASSRQGYQSIDMSNPTAVVITDHRLDVVGHEPCGWTNPTWPDEAEGRLAAHRLTCVYEL